MVKRVGLTSLVSIYNFELEVHSYLLYGYDLREYTDDDSYSPYPMAPDDFIGEYLW